MSNGWGLRLAAIAGCLVLAGCGSGKFQTTYQDVVDPAVSKGWRVSQIDVQVPEFLSVSEANSYAPEADIVWRGEPFGNRYEQVDAIMTEAVTEGASVLTGSRAVKLVIVMDTFHALTERTRYNLQGAGVHNIGFTAQVFDARTGEALTAPDAIDADLVGFTGNEAILAESRGETQRVRIVAHVSRVISGWLGNGPDVRGVFSRRGR